MENDQAADDDDKYNSDDSRSILQPIEHVEVATPQMHHNTTPEIPQGERKYDHDGNDKAKIIRKTKTEKSIDSAVGSFTAAMKEADMLFLKAEQDRQNIEMERMNVMKAMVQSQKEMDERRLSVS